MKKNINQILDNLSKTKIYFLTWLILLSFLLNFMIFQYKSFIKLSCISSKNPKMQDFEGQ